MGRKPIANPSAATLRKRKQRGIASMPVRQLDALLREKRKAECAKPSRLIAVTVYVPPADVKAINLTAERFRRIARISEDEVPDGASDHKDDDRRR